MKEQIIKLLLAYAQAETTVINEYSGNISEDLLKLHDELMEYCHTFDNVGADSEGVNFWKDIFPNLPYDIKRAYDEKYS